MQWVLAAALAVVAAATVARADVCAPPTPGEKVVPTWECCPAESVMPKVMTSKIEKCAKKYPISKVPQLPDKSFTPPPETRQMTSCTAECIFDEAGLLTKDKTLDKKALQEIFSGIGKMDEKFAAVLDEIVDRCYEVAAKAAETEQECKSGAMELQYCLTREGFLRCPKPLWQDTNECNALKKKVHSCPHMPVMLMPPGHN